MKYDDDTLAEINANANLFEYAQTQMDFVERQDHYFTNCPLHTDLTPSLCFTPSVNSFYCFSCGVGGGIIGYLMTFEKLSFDDAVQKAAKLASLDLSKVCKSSTMTMLKKYRKVLHHETDKFEHTILPDSTLDKFDADQKATEWLEEGISQEVMDLFGVRIDIYSNRIVYPVYDIQGNLINIKGRTRYPNYKELGLSKYINYYKVGVMDYFQGLNITLKDIKEANEIIIFESVKSVMKAYGWGYKNCVSAEKHTLTPEQIQLLVKLNVNIVFAYDSDVSYNEHDVAHDIDLLRRITNVYEIRDYYNSLGGKAAKNSPVDCGQEIWEELYSNKYKVV